MRVGIVMATYRGAQYLAQQLESIQAQTVTDWELLVRDDGSPDETVAMVQAFAARDPRIALLTDGRGRLGAVGNFGALVEAATTRAWDAVAFADQDDVWLPNKLQLQLELLERTAAQFGQATPIGVYSDLTVVNQELQEIHPSMMRFQGNRPLDADPLQVLLIQNVVTGCALVINRALLELVHPIPANVPVHDWWIALCAAAGGQLVHLPQATLLYRQHGNNTIGAQGGQPWQRLLRKLGQLTVLRQRYVRGVEQAIVLAQRLNERDAGPMETRAWLQQYCDLFAGQLGPWSRWRTARRLGIHGQGLPRNVLFAWNVFLHGAPIGPPSSQ